MSEKAKVFLPYALQKIEIEHFHCIQNIVIPHLTNKIPWIFLSGENGSGKTAFLQALTIGVCGPRNAGDLLRGQEKCRISAGLWVQGREKTNTVAWHTEIRGWSGADPVGYFCAYGPSRLEIQGDLSIGQERERIDPERNLLDQRGNLRNIERWIIGQKLREDSEPGTDIRRRNVMRLLEELLPNISEIRLEKDYLLYREKGYWAEIRQIGSGHRSILAMAGDILIRLFETQPEETDPEKLEGIVVIDELDIHIHPVYQREFPGLLSRTFPRVQFVCSAHSPIPLLGAPAGSKFFVVERDEVSGTVIRETGVDVSRMHPNALLSSPLFRLEDLFSDDLNGYESLDSEDTYKDILERRAIEEAIAKDAVSGKIIPKDWYKRE